MDNVTILVGALGLGLFTLVLTLLSTKRPSPAARASIPKRHPLRVYWDIANSYDPEPVALIWAGGSLAWGIFVATPFGATTAFPYGFPDNAVGVIVGLAGGAMLLAMGYDWHRIYGGATLALGMAWGFVGWSAWGTSGGHSSAWLVYAGAALITAWLWARLHLDDTKLSLLAEP